MKWTTEKIQEEALKYDRKVDFFRSSASAYNAAKNKKIFDEVCKHMKNGNAGENSCNYKWTPEKIQEEALKYNGSKDFINNSNNVYQVAQKRGILDKVCSHMPEYMYPTGEKHPNFKWTLEKLQTEALKYKSRREFELNCHGAYQAVQTRGLLDDICRHMTRPVGTSVPEKELLGFLRCVFPSARTLRDRKVKIKNKPFIYGFHIDIFISELNLGVEFDGRYHHSFEYMRNDKQKKLWSDEDIHNYHEIKDAWFATKGIKILHIKEEDWKKDKQACINRCLEFLGAKNG